MKKLILILSLLPLLTFAQSVKGNFSPAKQFSYAFLYKSTPEKAEYINRGKLDSLGNFEIKLDSTATPGIYKIVYALPSEKNNFDLIYDGKATVEFNFSYEKGVEFVQSQENILWNSYLKSLDIVNQTVSNFYTKQSKDKAAYAAIFKTLKETQNAYEESAEGKLVSAFIESNKPYIPSKYEDLVTYTNNVKHQYLNQVDYGNELLQSSSFLTNRVMLFVFNMVENPTKNMYIKHVDAVASAMNNENASIKAKLLEVLWLRFTQLENHELANYITDAYLLELAKTTKNKALEQTLISYKNTSIGAKAPNFDIVIDGNKTSLHQLQDAENYLIVFWSSACGHCLNELPTVKVLAAKNPNLKVVAFGLEKDTLKWFEEVKNYPQFTHVIGLGKWENPIVPIYGVTGTPSYFILNKDKTIASKPYSIEDLEAALKKL